jgi:hypothetical protein
MFGQAFCDMVASMMYRDTIDRDDFSVVVKNRAPLPRPWRWEIYRAGRKSPIEQSTIYFESMTEASRAGKAALRLLLGEYHA